MTDHLCCLGTFAASLGGSAEIPERWVDVIDPPPVETRTPEQIIAKVRASLKD